MKLPSPRVEDCTHWEGKDLRVMTPDIDIFRSANLWLGKHGDVAMQEARHRAAELQATGDRDGADVWSRIVVAIETLLTPTAGMH